MIVFESTVREERAAVIRQEAEMSVEKEIAAVEAYIVGIAQDRSSLRMILAKDASEHVHGRKNACLLTVGERRAIAVIVPKIRVEDLSLEDIPDQPTAIAAAVLYNHVAEAEIIEKIVIALASENDSVALLSIALDVEAFE